MRRPSPEQLTESQLSRACAAGPAGLGLMLDESNRVISCTEGGNAEGGKAVVYLTASW